MTTEEKRRARRKQSAEDFTPAWLVNQMLDKLEHYSPDIFSDPDKTFLDPAAGNGNMLIEVLKRKLKHATPLQAVSTIYGCDIFLDNAVECRLRLLKVVGKYRKEKQTKQQCVEIVKILARNIVHTPLDKYPNGSLDYLSLPESQTFYGKISDKRALQNVDTILADKLLDKLVVD